MLEFRGMQYILLSHVALVAMISLNLLDAVACDYSCMFASSLGHYLTILVAILTITNEKTRNCMITIGLDGLIMSLISENKCVIIITSVVEVILHVAVVWRRLPVEMDNSNLATDAV